MAIYELLPMAGPIKELVMAKASAEAICRRAIELGMRTMLQDGWTQVQQGLTTVEEVLRVTQESEGTPGHRDERIVGGSDAQVPVHRKT
jgi:type II secretory ATPase GspE/PulE/Tfp pilus assembly ATPase PilB-like protein